MTARAPTAPTTIFRKKLASGVNDRRGISSFERGEHLSVVGKLVSQNNNARRFSTAAVNCDWLLDAKIALYPHISPALFAFGLGDAALEGIPRPNRISRGRLGLTDQLAEVEKML